MTEELVIVRQLPEIEENLKAFKAEVFKKTQDAMKLVCTEETLASVKAVRAELRKEFKSLEDQQKAVKKMILAPYEAFEKVYSECVSDAFKSADAELKTRIDDVEGSLKAQKEERIRAYFDEYCEALGVDFVPFDRVVPNIIRSVSDKKYKEQCAAFIDRVVEDLAMIAEQGYADEIRAEYKKTLNAAQAVTTVAERHRAIEAEQARAEEEREAEEARKQAAEKVDEVLTPQVEESFAPPVAVQEAQVYEVHFTVRATKEQITALKQFLIEKEIEYV